MKTTRNISTAASIMALAIAVAVIGSDRAMAKENKQRSSSVRSTSTSSTGNSVRRSSRRAISDGTSNTLMVGERSAAGIISPKDQASGLPTGIVSGGHTLRGPRNTNHPGWATFPSSRKSPRR